MLAKQIPQQLPQICQILENLGSPRKEVAALLGVNRRTLARWCRNDDAPLQARLALFWLTSWGRSSVDCSAVNDAVLQAQLARCAQAQAESHLSDVLRLMALGDFGSANSPLMLHRNHQPAAAVAQAIERRMKQARPPAERRRA